jgi:beta-glucanase (GH16 family)
VIKHLAVAVIAASSLLSMFTGVVRADGPMPLAKFDAPGVEKRFKPTDAQVAVEKSAEGLVVTIAPGKSGYPGVDLVPEAGDTWDLGGWGRVDVKLTNLGAKPITVTARIDDNGPWQSNPWNGENVGLKPGESKTGRVYFGYSWGKPGYKLNASAIKSLKLFTGTVKDEVKFRIENIEAAGTPGEAPPVAAESIRIKPDASGVLLGPGNAKVEASGREEAGSAVEGDAVAATFAAGKKNQSVSIKPSKGRWDLREFLEVRVTVKNAGAAPATPRVRVETNNNGASKWALADTPLAPGAERELVVPFITDEPVVMSTKADDKRFVSDAVGAITLAPVQPADAKFLVTAIKAAIPPAPTLPAWLGKRPPVAEEKAGEWVQTFNDDFDGQQVDAAKWNIYGENYWDKQSHFSKDNVVVENGVVRLRFEKKSGPHNDDPNHKRGVTPYATGFLQTYGKWVQRYGYFEARMKLPKAPGLWPAFWMMPDRGEAAGEQWKRADTKNGGMEFDILEHLTRWGPYRYNIAQHWDGYGKEHKSNGTSAIYVQPDADGFITAGLLWTPGSLVYYAQGKEVARWEDARISSVPAEIMFTLPHGGWDNSPIDDGQLPADFVVDYVRAWQRRDLASDADTTKAK